MKKIFFCCFFLISVAQMQAQRLGFQLKDNAKRVEIPFEFLNNLIIIPVILNNQIPLKFILDTGVRTTILTEKTYSDLLNLTYSRKYTISGLGNEKSIDAYVTNNVTLTLPGVEGTGHAMLVLEEDYLELRSYIGIDVQGIVGYEIFSRFVVEINYENRVITLIEPEHYKPKRSSEVIPIDVQDTKPYIQGYIAYYDNTHTEVKLLIDTGASHGLQLETASDEKIFIPDKNISASLGRGLGGIIKGKLARIKAFHLGDICWTNPIASFPESNSFLDSIKNLSVSRNGSIGGEVLSRFHVALDFSSEKIYLKKNKKFKENFSYNISGIELKATGELLQKFEIIEVRENSLGEVAGFKEGDMLVSINNTATDELQLNEVIDMLNARENKKVKLVVQRNGQTISRTFRLKGPL